MADSALPQPSPADVFWASLDPATGREQGGHRPVLVVSTSEYLEIVTTLVIAVPITTTDRGWPNHVRVRGPEGLRRPSWAMTEQVRTISRNRLSGYAGRVDAACFADVRTWIGDFLDLG